MFHHLSHSQLRELCKIFKELTGIEYNKEKIYLFENRLTKFVGETRDFHSYDELIVALNKRHNRELREQYVNQLTTNYTYFFRESVHFRFLQYIVKNKFEDINSLRVWSAAASGGHEAYSIAMTLDPILTESDRNYSILGTDIARDKIEQAREGVYQSEEIDGHIHKNTVFKNFIKIGNDYKVTDRIKKRVKFAPLNIMGTYPFTKKFHIIFLRNILIYFKSNEKELILNNIANYLDPNGYLIISISESLTGLNIPFKHISHSIYKHAKERHVLL